MSGNCRYVPPPIASQTSITSTVPMTSANTSLQYSDRSGHLSLVTGNLTTSLRPAYWTFVQSPRRIASCPARRAALTASWARPALSSRHGPADQETRYQRYIARLQPPEHALAGAAQLRLAEPREVKTCPT